MMFKNGKKKLVSIAVVFILICSFAASAFATSTFATCPYAANHGNHTSGTMERYFQVFPDYVAHDYYYIEYWYCTGSGCKYTCCANSEHFGNIISRSLNIED